MTRLLASVFLTFLAVWPNAVQATERNCAEYEVGGIRLGMSPGEVWKILGRKGGARSIRTDPSGPVTIDSYTRQGQPIDVEYDRAPIAKRSGSVVLVRGRLVGDELRSPAGLSERFGAPTAGADLLSGRFVEGDAVVWLDTPCKVAVRVYLVRPDWWDSGGETLAIEIQSMDRAIAAGHVLAGSIDHGPGGPEAPASEAASVSTTMAASEPLPAGARGVSLPQRIPSTYVEPVYPRSLRAMGIEGLVTLRLTIDREGIVSRARVDDASSARPEFDEAALNAVRQWRYRPATLDGVPVESELVVNVEFKR